MVPGIDNYPIDDSFEDRFDNNHSFWNQRFLDDPHIQNDILASFIVLIVDTNDPIDAQPDEGAIIIVIILKNTFDCSQSKSILFHYK